MPRAPRLSQHEIDDEFERFLKESLSDADDSLDAGKLKKFFDPQKRAEDKKKKKADQPWWMDDDDDDGGGGRGTSRDKFKKETPLSTNKWLKPKKQSTPVIQEDEEDEEEEQDTPVTSKGKHQLPSRYSKGSEVSSKPSSDEARRLKPSISRDSLESTSSPRGKEKRDYDSDEFSSDNEERSGVYSVQRGFEDSMSYTGPSEGTTLGSTGPGAETMEEMADKARFFQQLEENKGGRVDYNKLNKDVDMTGTMGTMGSLPSPYMGTADEHSSPIAQITKSAEAKVALEETDTKSKEDSSSKVSPVTVKDTKKPPSMLSRVALLDTADSTMNVTKKDVSPEKGGEGDAKIQSAVSKGLTVTGATEDMEALHAALRNAANTPTLGLEDSSYGVTTHQHINPVPNPAEVPAPQLRTVEDIIREIEEERKRKREKEKEEENKRKEEEELQRRKEEELRRKEMESKDAMDSIDGGFRTELGERTNFGDGLEPRMRERSGFDLSPVHTQEGRGFNLSPANEGRGFDLQPANEGRGFDLQPTNEGRGFNLQPTNEGRGFDLQPTNEGRGFDLQPTNEGRGFDLQPASADDEVSYGITSSTPSKKETQKRSGKSKGRFGSIKSSGYGKPKTKSHEAWSPATAAKHKVKGSEMPVPGRHGAVETNRNLVQSVESFATYIQEHFADSRKLTPPPEARYSREEPIISASMRESKIQHLSRERALVNEVTEWQNQWKEAHRLNAKLKAELATHQREFARKEEELRLLHEKELFKVKQDNFVLQAKLNTEEEQKRVKNRAMSGRSLEGASEEELKLMQREIIEQETLLQGYQQENERLYREVKKLQTSNKDSEEVLFKENQKLHTEVATVRELLEQKEVALRHKGIITGAKAQQEIAAGNTAILGAGRIAELQGEAKDDKIREIELKQQIRSLEQTIKELELHIDAVVRERNHSEDKLKNLRDVKQREFQDMQQQYKREIDNLQKKLRWYAENQELLDKDSHTLKEKDGDVKRLKDALEKANKNAGHKSQDAQRRAKERAADAKKIQDLERQVKEMNDIIRRRYPNSLPALIYAAAYVPEEGQDSQPQPPTKSHTAAFLEEKAKQLEDELADKGEEVKRSLRVMEQKYNLMKFQYEDRVQKLEKQLEETKSHQPTRPHTNVTAMERELQNVKQKYRRKLEEAQADNEELRKTLAKGKGGGRWKGESIGQGEESGGKDRQEVGFSAADLQEKLTLLASELSNKDHEIEMLKGVCDRLMHESFQAQTETEASKAIGSETKSSRKSGQASRRPPSEAFLDNKQYKPQNFAGSHISDVILENEHLKRQMETLSLEMEQQRLRVQATLAEAESNVRKTKEAAAEEVSVIKSKHVEEIDKLIAERALLHSNTQAAKLCNQVESQKVLISHLQEELSDVRVEADVAAASRVREQLMKTQRDQLKGELEDAKKSHTPEMRHFEALHFKIAAMEARHSQREQELHLLVERAKHTATIEKDQEITVYRGQLAKKNVEIQRFRAELDSILEILRELQRQGVILPMQSHTVQSLL